MADVDDYDNDPPYGSSPPQQQESDEEIMHPHDDFEYQDNQTIREECIELFQTKDFLMETQVIPTVKRFLNAGGEPQEFVELLAENYQGMAQVSNLLADWLIVAGTPVEEVQDLVEKNLKELIVKNFDPKKADSIFSGAGQPPTWIEEMIAYAPWRTMFYELADKYPDCLMLNFTIKMISDAGYQSEVGTIYSVCNQIDVFSKVIKTSIINFFTRPQGEQNTNIINDFVKACCHGKHLYLYSQCLLSKLDERMEDGIIKASVKRFAQELEKGALQSGHDIWNLSLFLQSIGLYPRILSSISSLVNKRVLNPGDITVLYKAYTSNDPPPVNFLRIPVLLDLFVTSLFIPTSTIPQDHLPKYIYLLGYAVAVFEQWDEGRRDSIHKDELHTTIQAIERAHETCSNEIGSSSLTFTSDVAALYQCLRFPVVSMGLLRWISECMSEKNYAKVITESSPLQIVMLDEICTCHPLQHELIMELLKTFFERTYPDLDTLIELEFKKTLIDRMVHMLSRGYVMPVVLYIKDCMDRQITDVSLLRHFVTEILEMIAPPYSHDFMAALLPIIQNNEVTGPLKSTDLNDDVTQFLAHCENG